MSWVISSKLPRGCSNCLARKYFCMAAGIPKSEIIFDWTTTLRGWRSEKFDFPSSWPTGQRVQLVAWQKRGGTTMVLYYQMLKWQRMGEPQVSCPGGIWSVSGLKKEKLDMPGVCNRSDHRGLESLFSMLLGEKQHRNVFTHDTDWLVKFGWILTYLKISLEMVLTRLLPRAIQLLSIDIN